MMSKWYLSLTRRNYAKGALSVEETTDEDGITVATFTDMRGNCVMRRQGPARTYYVYDGYGDLRYILPPDMPERSYTASDATLIEQAYIYRYDSRGRLIYSKIPGCGASEFIYDNADRLVAENNADLGAKWRFHFYDGAGREVLVTEGTFTPDNSARATLAQPRTATRGSSSSEGLRGYTTGYTLPADNKVTQAIYYDDYTLCAPLGNDGAAYITAPAGLQTGLWAATDDGGGVSEVYWYDRNGRKAYESIDTAPGRVCRAMRYNYAGQQNEDYELVYDKTVLPWKSWRVQRNIFYDNAGRISSERTKLDTCTVITNYTYDGAGRVSRTVTGLLEESSTSLGGAIASDNVRRDYTYDVHDWPVKIVTGVPMEKAPVFPGTLEISTPYYEAASASSLPQLSLLKKEYTETIHYADGANPRYNGTPSARGLTQGGRYDYRYDELDRLIGADYSAPSGTPDADFSTEYTYDILSRLTSIKRHGVVDIDGDTEVFGILDDITLTYSGAVLARMQSNITEETGRNFYGRTGWAEGTFMPSATVSYNAAGRLTSDSGRMLGAVSYNTIGLPTRYSTGAGSSASTSPRKERCYDATGRKLRQTEYEAVRGKMTKTSDRRYVGSMTFNADTLERVDFTGGYFDGRGAAHYLFTDWQGNVTITTDAAGKIEQHIGYYPYGEPWREPSGQRATLFAGKERLSGQAAGDSDFGPRGYRPTIAYWDSWDQKSGDYPWWSPGTYCGGNPIKNIDPSGNVVIITGDDALKAVEELQNRIKNAKIFLETDHLKYEILDESRKLKGDTKLIAGIIDDSSITVNLKTLSGNNASTGALLRGGVFMGNKVFVDGDGNITVEAFQEVNVTFLSTMSKAHNKVGADLLHELTEAYEGAKISKAKKESSPMSGVKKSVYEKAHQRATPQSGEIHTKFYNNENIEILKVAGEEIPRGASTVEYYVRDPKGDPIILQKRPLRP